MINQHGILVLAAGASTRLGRPKQMEIIEGKPLLQGMVETAIATGCSPIVVVLGAYSTEIGPLIAHLPIVVLDNPDWATGMGSTVACGMRFFMENHPSLASVVVLACDQVLLGPSHISELICTFETTKKAVVASEYDGTIGVPALFSNHKFAALASLKGNDGAKRLIQEQPDDLATVLFPEGAFDLDTEDDLAKMTRVVGRLPL